MINQFLHQTWVGGEMPSHLREWCAEWKGLHPESKGWQYRLWGQDGLDMYASDPYLKWLLDTGDKLAFVTDRLRVLILRDFGGIYLDADCQPVRPLDSIGHILRDPGVDFLCGMRSPDRKHVAVNRGVSLIDNTVMGTAKNGRLINKICALWTPEAKRRVGCDVGHEVMRNCDRSTCILNSRYFYSSEVFPETILLHDDRNLSSWSRRVIDTPKPLPV